MQHETCCRGGRRSGCRPKSSGSRRWFFDWVPIACWRGQPSRFVVSSYGMKRFDPHYNSHCRSDRLQHDSPPSSSLAQFQEYRAVNGQNATMNHCTQTLSALRAAVVRRKPCFDGPDGPRRDGEMQREYDAPLRGGVGVETPIYCSESPDCYNGLCKDESLAFLGESSIVAARLFLSRCKRTV